MITDKRSIKHALFYAIFSGMIGGLLLAILLKAVQYLTDLKLYSLLLNVDYIPIFNRREFSEPIEVLFHLVISIILAFFFYVGIHKFNIQTRKGKILFCVIVSFLIGALIYPTTSFSQRTPPLTSIPSLIYWLGCHAVYGFSMGLLLLRSSRQIH